MYKHVDIVEIRLINYIRLGKCIFYMAIGKNDCIMSLYLYVYRPMVQKIHGCRLLTCKTGQQHHHHRCRHPVSSLCVFLVHLPQFVDEECGDPKTQI
jgi:hypothetical protein